MHGTYVIICLCLFTLPVFAEKFNEVASACKRAIQFAKFDKFDLCQTRLVLSDDSEICANIGAYCTGGPSCDFEKDLARTCPGFFSLQYLEGSRFRLILVGKVEDKSGWMMMRFGKNSNLTNPDNPDVMCASIATRNHGKGAVDLASDQTGINIDEAKTKLVLDAPWLICSFEFTPSPTFSYNKDNFDHYKIAGSNGTKTTNSSSDISTDAMWGVRSGEPNPMFRIMMSIPFERSTTSSTLTSTAIWAIVGVCCVFLGIFMRWRYFSRV